MSTLDSSREPWDILVKELEGGNLARLSRMSLSFLESFWTSWTWDCLAPELDFPGCPKGSWNLCKSSWESLHAQPLGPTGSWNHCKGSQEHLGHLEHGIGGWQSSSTLGLSNRSTRIVCGSSGLASYPGLSSPRFYFTDMKKILFSTIARQNLDNLDNFLHGYGTNLGEEGLGTRQVVASFILKV